MLKTCLQLVLINFNQLQSYLQRLKEVSERYLSSGFDRTPSGWRGGGANCYLRSDHSSERRWFVLFSRRNSRWKTKNLGKSPLTAVNFSPDQWQSSPGEASWPRVEAVPQLEAALPPPALPPRATRSCSYRASRAIHSTSQCREVLRRWRIHWGRSCSSMDLPSSARPCRLLLLTPTSQRRSM